MIATNGQRENQRVKLRALGIDDAFHTRFFAGDETPPKPAPEPFRSALQGLDVEPSAAYYVGNSLAHDVVGAKRVGLGAGWFPHEYARDEDPAGHDHPPDHTFETLHEIETVLPTGEGGARDG